MGSLHDFEIAHPDQGSRGLGGPRSERQFMGGAFWNPPATPRMNRRPHAKTSRILDCTCGQTSSGFRVEAGEPHQYRGRMNSSEEFSDAMVIALADGRVIYWNQAAAAEFGWPQVEARKPAEPGAAAAASDAPETIHLEGSPGSDAVAPQARIVLESGKTVWLESKRTLLADAEGEVCGHWHRLRQAKSSGPARAPDGPPPADTRGVAERQVLHQLNNFFASIHSSLDLALGIKEPAEVAAFLQQAQESARKGAQIIHELQVRQMAVPGGGAASAGNVRPYAAVLATTSEETSPAGLEGKERLLLAEDSKSMRALIRAVLTYRGYTVVEAADGEEAVSRFIVDGPFDLVLLDMGLPKLVGPEVLRRLRARNPAVRALALSGSLFGGEEAGVNPGGSFDGFLNKPFRNVELVKLVRRILDQPAAV